MSKVKWNSLLSLDTHLDSFTKMGATVEYIGKTRNGNQIPAITIGERKANIETVLIVAGMHAVELSGCLSAISLCYKFLEDKKNEFFITIVPALDFDYALENSAVLDGSDSFKTCSSLSKCRDLEGQFSGKNHVECEALKNYIDKFKKIDYYFSLHSTNYATPGAFFYLSGKCQQFVLEKATHLTDKLSSKIPLLDYDPTKMSEVQLSKGFFFLATAQQMSSIDSEQRYLTSLEYVSQSYGPKLLGVPEVPLGLFNLDREATLDDISNVTFGKGQDNVGFRELSLDEQINVISYFVISAIE
jgi:hypothetical protein